MTLAAIVDVDGFRAAYVGSRLYQLSVRGPAVVHNPDRE
jgi:hypothetical protein